MTICYCSLRTGFNARCLPSFLVLFSAIILSVRLRHLVRDILEPLPRPLFLAPFDKVPSSLLLCARLVQQCRRAILQRITLRRLDCNAAAFSEARNEGKPTPPILAQMALHTQNLRNPDPLLSSDLGKIRI